MLGDGLAKLLAPTPTGICPHLVVQHGRVIRFDIGPLASPIFRGFSWSEVIQHDSHYSEPDFPPTSPTLLWRKMVAQTWRPLVPWKTCEFSYQAETIHRPSVWRPPQASKSARRGSDTGANGLSRSCRPTKQVAILSYTAVPMSLGLNAKWEGNATRVPTAVSLHSRFRGRDTRPDAVFSSRLTENGNISSH